MDVLQTVIDKLVFAAAVVAVVAYLCRLDALRYGKHKPGVIIFHACLGAACAAAGEQAWTDKAGLLEVFAVVGALVWIRISWPRWRHNVPREFSSSYTPLDEAAPPAANRG